MTGFRRLLAPTGVVTFEFPHLLQLEGNQFDTLYHEHFCYFSFMVASVKAAGPQGRTRRQVA